LIDGIIAAFGLRGAQEKRCLSERGEITPATQQEQAKRFEQIVWMNAVSDILYVLTGGWLIARNPQREDRRSMGWGIFIQGFFLLVWDLWLGMAAHEKRHTT